MSTQWHFHCSFLVSSSPLFLPYSLQKLTVFLTDIFLQGARYIAIIAGTIACVGTWIKLFAVGPDRFMLLMIGQVLESISYAICYGMLALIPAYWFGTKEISFAGNLPVMGIQVSVEFPPCNHF